jgi:Acetyltransferases
MKNYIIRELKQSEFSILDDMLYEAIYQHDTANPLPKNIIELPKINVYIKDFGKQTDDYCLVADVNGKIVGAVWVRILAGEVKGYGNIDDKTPEFAISLFKEFRNQGIGTQLMTEMIDYLRKSGYEKTSLSVDKENYAVKMYKKLGFEVVAENDDDYLMVLKLSI